MDAPCKDCAYRRPNCHSICAAYREFRQACNDRMAERLRNYMANKDMFAHQENLHQKIRRHTHATK